MLISIFRAMRPMFLFDGGEPAGGAPAGEPAAGAPAGEPAAGAPAGEPAGGAPPAVDWSKRVADEWGGEDNVTKAIELQRALQTREGVRALADESLRALGIGDDKIAALFGAPAASEQGETVEQLLADPERVLTAAEIKRVLDHERAQTRSQMESQTHQQQISTTVDKTLTDLKVSTDDRDIILAMADRFMAVPAPQATPAQVADAIKKAHDTYGNTVKKAADAYIDEKRRQRGETPRTPAGGGSGGGKPVDEPKTVEEAKRRVRALIEAGTGD